MSDFRRYLERQIQDPEFRAEHEATRSEYEAARALIEERISEEISQKEPVERADPPISRPARAMDC